jgi:hypothetical protein
MAATCLADGLRMQVGLRMWERIQTLECVAVGVSSVLQMTGLLRSLAIAKLVRYLELLTRGASVVVGS